MKTVKQPSSQTSSRVVSRPQDRPGDHGDQTSVNSRDASHRHPDDVVRVGATEYHLPDGGVRPYVYPGEPHRKSSGGKAPFPEAIGKRHGSPWLSEFDNRRTPQPARRSSRSGR